MRQSLVKFGYMAITIIGNLILIATNEASQKCEKMSKVLKCGVVVKTASYFKYTNVLFT